MRNVFDQYEQPENRLTHAFMVSLEKDRTLLKAFLKWIEAERVPPVSSIQLAEQEVPGFYKSSDDKSERKGLPDGFIYSREWAVLIESKVQSRLSKDQLDRHQKTAERSGFVDIQIVAITVDPFKGKLPPNSKVILWTSIYQWLGNFPKSEWAQDLRQYMEIFEQNMVLSDYQIRGTVTVFDGFHFDQDNPYTYNEGKRLIRLLGDELQVHPSLVKLGVDPKGKRRGQITGKQGELVWDFLPLKWPGKSGAFTSTPHLTLTVRRNIASTGATIPNGIRGGFKSKLSRLGCEGFTDIVLGIEEALRPVCKKSKNARPVLQLVQRHYKSQSSPAIVDARMEFDIRSLVPGKRSRQKHQPQWIDAMYDVLTNKRSNMQFGLEVFFNYDCPVLRSRNAINLFAEAMQAIYPLFSILETDS